MVKLLRNTYIIGIAYLVFFVLFTSCDQQASVDDKKYNVLFIAVDDLRSEIGYYGNESIHTPNIDKLAAQSRVFSNHFVHVAACGPSRSTLLSGRRTLSWDIFKNIRESGQKPDSIFSMPQLFKDNGYATIGIGKISHKPGGVMDSLQRIPEVPFSWDTTYAPVGKWKDPWNAFFSYSNGDTRTYGYDRSNDTSMPPFEDADVTDNGYADGLNAEEAIKQLRELRGKRFFLAVGFYKPHLPFNAPQKYWDLYDKENIPSSSFNKPPKDNIQSNVSLHADHRSYEPRTHYKWPSDSSNYIITPDRERTLKQGYYAAVSYVDAQIGKVLNEVKSLGLDKNTIVVLWGDHGWHLGEYGIWGKYTLFDNSLKSPLIINVPGMNNKGEVSNSIVETVDIFPTLADLCELPIPEYVEGRSMIDIINYPDSEIKKYSIGERNAWGVHAYTIRNQRYRMITWRPQEKDSLEIELYDYLEDPPARRNIADEKPMVVNKMMKQLKSHYQL